MSLDDYVLGNVNTAGGRLFYVADSRLDFDCLPGELRPEKAIPLVVVYEDFDLNQVRLGDELGDDVLEGKTGYYPASFDGVPDDVMETFEMGYENAFNAELNADTDTWKALVDIISDKKRYETASDDGRQRSNPTESLPGEGFVTAREMEEGRDPGPDKTSKTPVSPTNAYTRPHAEKVPTQEDDMEPGF